MNATDTASDAGHRRGVRIALIAGLLASLGYLGWNEWDRQHAKTEAGVGETGWYEFLDLQSTPYALWFATLPLFWLVRSERLLPSDRMRRRFHQWSGEQTRPPVTNGRLRVVILAGVVFLTSLAASWNFASQQAGTRSWSKSFQELPPVYHDEYSYLLQAKLFAKGRWSVPSHPTHPALFDQMHVVNDGRLASRYFPSTAAWMTPFVAIGRPYWGHWLAGALAAVFVFLAGRELGGNGVGFLAGMLMGVSPGLAIFSNLLLAHHPTLLGLTGFLYFYLRMLRTGGWPAALFAGIGLSFAMLARPMTAAAFGLPFGIAFLCRLRLSDDASSTNVAKPQAAYWARFVAMGIPLIFGFAVLAWQNIAITGDALTTPYGQFQTKYTPCHVYGFNNIERAEAKIADGAAGGDRTFDRYDRWATNLTWSGAWANVNTRFWTSLRFTFAVIPLLFAGVVFVVSEFMRIRRSLSQRPNSHEFGYIDRRWPLIAWAIVSLHLAHLPYWFTGIMDWHYIFETAPLWLLLFSGVTGRLCRHWADVRRYGMTIWWAGLIGMSVIFGWYSPDEDWWRGAAPVDDAASQIAFTKIRYEEFERFVENTTRDDDRALVLVEADPAQFHFEYVRNEPDVDRRVLIGRYRKGTTDLEGIAKAFPGRAVYHVRNRGGGFQVIDVKYSDP